MGTVFSLYKRKPKQRYELGKNRQGYAPGLHPPEISLSNKISVITAAFKSIVGSPTDKQFSDYYDSTRALTHPGWNAMWSIMGTPNYSIFKLSRFTRDELADIMYRTSLNIDTMDVAFKVADHMLAWAGDDDITLNPEEPNDLADLDWPTRGYKNVGGIWDAI